MKNIWFTLTFFLFVMTAIKADVGPLKLPTATVVPATTSTSNDGAIDLTVVGGWPPFVFQWSNGETTEDISNLSSGSYTVHVYDRYCGVIYLDVFVTDCEGIPMAFTILEIHSNTENSNSNNGEIDITVTGNPTGTYTYQWTDASNNQVISTNEDLFNLTVGTYCVEVFDACGASITECIDIVSCDIDVDFSVTHISEEGLSDGQIDLTASGQAPFSYIWSTSATTEDIENLATGLYTLTISYLDGMGIDDCTFEYDVMVQPDNYCNDCYPIDADIASGSIFVQIECQEAGGFTYQWSDGATGNPRTDLMLGEYCVTATSDNGCVMLGCWEVTSACTPTQLTNADAEIIAACTAAPMSGSIEILNPISGGFYNWTGADSYTNSGSTINNLVAGEYCVSITTWGNSTCPQAVGCFTIEADGDQCCDDCYPMDANVGEGSIFVNLECQETGGFIYVWSDGAIGNYRTGLATGEYCVTATSSTGCFLSGCWEVVEACPDPQILTEANANVSCSSGTNGSISLIDLPTWNGSPISASWTGPNGYSANGENITNLEIGEYCVTISYVFGQYCPLATACYIVKETDNQIEIEASVVGPICGNTVGYINLGVFGEGVLKYKWSNGSNQQNQNNLLPGTYCVTVTSTSDACSVFACYEIEEGIDQEISVELVEKVNIPLCNTQAGPGDVCQGSSINIEPSGGGTSYTYEWSGPFGYIATTQDLTDVCEGNYTVTVTSSQGCTGTRSVRICCCDEAPDTPGNGSCYGDGQATTFSVTDIIYPVQVTGVDDGAINLTITGGSSDFMISWSGPGGFTANTEDITGLAPGDYCVDIKDGCDVRKYCFEVVDCSLQNMTIYGDPTPSCPGASAGSITITNVTGGTPDYKYDWGNGSSSANETISQLAAGNYTVTVTDKNRCTETATFVVEDVEPVINVAQPNIGHTCSGYDNGSISLTGQVSGNDPPFSYQWSTGSTNSSISNLGEGIYTVKIIDSRGCSTERTYTINSSNTVMEVEEEFRQFCEINFECNGQIIDELTELIGYNDYYDPDNCQWLIHECLDGDYYYPFGTEESSLEYVGTVTEYDFVNCIAIEYCENGQQYGDIIEGTIDTMHFDDYDITTDDCIYCFTATYCYLGGMQEVINVESNLAAALEVIDENIICGADSCQYNIYCSLLEEGDNVLLVYCDDDCDINNDLCDESEMLQIAEEGLVILSSGGFVEATERTEDLEELASEGLSIKIYPNPFQSDFYLQIESELTKKMNLKILNVAGVLINSVDLPVLKGKNLFHINDLESQNVGTYFLTISDNKNLLTFPVVKQ